MARVLRIFFVFILLGFFIFNSCIDRFNIPLDEPDFILNVEGYITTQPRSHQIRLSRAAKYGPDFLGPSRPVNLATVLIKDNEEKSVLLPYTENGIYITPDDFAAKVGNSYNLEITLPNGDRYISTKEYINSVPKMDSVTYQAVRTASENRLNDEIGVQIIGHFQDPQDEVNYYYWRKLESDFVIIAEPELYTLPPTHPTNPRGSAPKDCCVRCFYKEFPAPPSIMTVSDEFFNGNYQRRMVAYILDDGTRFKDTYRLDLQHLSVSAEAHRFLTLMDQQLRLTGSVFDPPPANIRGNVVSLKNPQEQVLGYFFVSDEQFIRTYIKKENLEFFLTPQSTIPDDCREYLNIGGSNSSPGFTPPKLSVEPPPDWNPD
jgi:hypothetical protein